MAPIFLRPAASTQTTDDAGVVITKHVLPTYNEGPYHKDYIPYYMKAETELTYVPSLAYFSIKALCKVIDRINFDGCPRPVYHVQSHARLLKSLIPFLGPGTRPSDVKYVDPLLWGTLIQLYAELPAFFHVYPIPLSDKYLPLLQGIQSTSDFTLITVLDLSACGYLSDDTIGELKPLTNLCVLDMSRTTVSSWGIKMLSMCLVRNNGERFGPWGIRIWSMRGCQKIDNKVKETLGKFPLLSVVDLRGTSVTSSPFCDFVPQPDASLDNCYYPNPPLSWIDGLLYSSGHLVFAAGLQRIHVLHVNRLEHPESTHRFSENKGVYSSQNQRFSAVSEQDSSITFLPNGYHTNCATHDISRGDSLEPSHNQLEGVRRQPRERQRYTNHPAEDGCLHTGDCNCERYTNDGNDCNLDKTDCTQENEIAGVLVAKENTKRQVLRFYQQRPVSGSAARSPNGLRRAILDLSPNDTETPLCFTSSKATFDDIPPTEYEIEDREKDTMFFRVPPAFDSIADHNDVKVTKRQNADDVILSKRRKATDGTQNISIAITPANIVQMRHGGKQSHTPGGYSSCTPGISHRSKVTWRKIPDLTNTQEATRDGSSPVSRNPFLAKRKVTAVTATKKIQATMPSSNVRPNIDRFMASSTFATSAKNSSSEDTRDRQYELLLPGKSASTSKLDPLNPSPVQLTINLNKNGIDLDRNHADNHTSSKGKGRVTTAKSHKINAVQVKARPNFDMKAWAKKSIK